MIEVGGPGRTVSTVAEPRQTVSTFAESGGFNVS